MVIIEPIIMDDKELVRLYRQTLDNVYLEQLLDRHNLYIIKVTNTIFKKHGAKYSYEDVRQEVLLEFINIVKTKFKLESNNTFFTYAFKTLKFASLNFIRDDKFFPLNRNDRMKNTKGNIVFATDMNYLFDSKTESKVVDYLSSKFLLKNQKTVVELVEENIIIENVRALLTNKEFDVLYDYIVREKSQTLIAKEIGTNQTAISKMIINSIKKIEESIPLF